MQGFYYALRDRLTAATCSEPSPPKRTAAQLSRSHTVIGAASGCDCSGNLEPGLLLALMQWLTHLDGESIAVTGTVWCPQSELLKRARRLGAKVSSNGRITAETTLLVRGASSLWQYGDYGWKELRAAQLIREGHRISLVHDFEFRKVLDGGRRARLLDRIAGQPIEWLTGVTKKQFEAVARIDGPLDREQTTRGRVEQSFLRWNLFGRREEDRCSLCGRLLPTSLLVAAHIKPRSECSKKERLDVKNIVFGLCVLGCDALYERGLLIVGREGAIRTSEAGNSAALRRILPWFCGRKCTAWRTESASYFAWHASRRFQP